MFDKLRWWWFKKTRGIPINYGLTWQSVKKFSILDFENYLAGVQIGSDKEIPFFDGEYFCSTYNEPHSPSDFSRIWALWGIENGYDAELYNVLLNNTRRFTGCILAKDGVFISCGINWKICSTKQSAVNSLGFSIGDLESVKIKKRGKLKCQH